MSYSWELVDSPIRLVNSVILLGEFKLQKNFKQSCSSKKILGIVKKTLGLVRGSYSLPEWQALKLTFLCTLLISLLISVQDQGFVPVIENLEIQGIYFKTFFLHTWNSMEFNYWSWKVMENLG